MRILTMVVALWFIALGAGYNPKNKSTSKQIMFAIGIGLIAGFLGEKK